MLWASRIRLRLRALLRKKTLDTQLSQEMAFHLEEQKAEYISLGMSEAEAEAAARKLFGPTVALEEACRDERRMGWLEDFLQDTRYAWRGFWRSPSFTIVAVLTLALGIGANTAFFSTAYGILFRPLPYPDPDRLIDMEDGVTGVGPVTSLREMARAADYAGYSPKEEVNLQLAGEAWRVRASAVTWNLPRVLGTHPARGRWFEESEERAGQRQVVVLSDRTWRRRFAADPGILGRRILLNEESFEVTGVMPPDFSFPSPDTELWIPIRVDARKIGYMWGGGSLRPIGRLREGMTVAAAQAELAPAIDRIRRMFPWRMPDAWARGARVASRSEALVKDVRPKLFALTTGALLLLLIACANVANLLLARALRREREFAMREAIGASRGRLLRQSITETVLLVVAGGGAGLLTGFLILKSLPLLLPPDTPRLHEIVPDPAMILAAASTMLLTIGLFSAAPVIRLWRVRRETLIGRAITSSRRTSGSSLALIGIELALATALLIGAGLMERTLWRLAHVDSGIHAVGVVSAQISAGPSRCGNSERCSVLVQDLSRVVAGLPGVVGVNWSNAAPLDKEFSAVSVAIQDHPKPPEAPAYVLWQTAASPGYFQALGIPLRIGRVFTEGDHAGAAPVIVIGESMARRFWPNENAIGKRIRPMSDNQWRTVIGVVGDVAQYALTGFPSWVDGVQYVPLAQMLPRAPQSLQLTMFVESAQPAATRLALAGRVRELFSDVVVFHVTTLEEIRSESVADQRSIAWLLALLAGLGLILGLVGVYGVISHRAAQRTREIGIRMALGANAGKVIRMVLRETLLVSVAGIGAGVAAGMGLSRFLSSVLFGVTGHDAFTLVIFPAALLAAALLAAAVPGVRASRTDPAVTLREE
jgi:predicted permease